MANKKEIKAETEKAEKIVEEVSMEDLTDEGKAELEKMIENGEAIEAEKTEDVELKKAQIHAEAIAEAISEKEDNKKKFKIVSDEGIQPLYSIAKDPTTGEVYTIDNQEPDLNARVKKIQIQSIEEAAGKRAAHVFQRQNDRVQ